MTTAIARLHAWLHAPTTAERLAGLRIATAGFVVVYVVLHVREFSRLANGSADGFRTVGLARILSEPLPSIWVWAMFAGLIGAGLLFAAGVAVRAVGPLFAVLLLFWTSYHSSWGQLLHFEHLFTLHVMILALAPTADAWSLSRRNQPRPTPHVRYGWPIRLLALATVATYVLSGIAKLRHSGLAWFDPDTLANHIGYSATRMQTIGGRTPPLAEFVLGARWLIAPMAFGALAVELGAPLALRRRRTRIIWALAALIFHAGTAATMMVFFGYRGLGFGLLPLFAHTYRSDSVAATDLM